MQCTQHSMIYTFSFQEKCRNNTIMHNRSPSVQPSTRRDSTLESAEARAHAFRRAPRRAVSSALRGRMRPHIPHMINFTARQRDNTGWPSPPSHAETSLTHTPEKLQPGVRGAAKSSTPTRACPTPHAHKSCAHLMPTCRVGHACAPAPAGPISAARLGTPAQWRAIIKARSALALPLPRPPSGWWRGLRSPTETALSGSRSDSPPPHQRAQSVAARRASARRASASQTAEARAA